MKIPPLERLSLCCSMNCSTDAARKRTLRAAGALLLFRVSLAIWLLRVPVRTDRSSDDDVLFVYT